MQENPLEAPRLRWGIFDFIAFVVVGFIAFLVVFGSATQIFGVQQLQTAPVLALVQGAFELILLGFILLLSRMHHSSFRDTIHWHPQPYAKGFLVTLGISLAFSVTLLGALLPKTPETAIEKLMTSTTSIVILAVFGITAAPLIEEILFRGFFYKVFHDMAGPGTAIGVSTLLFAGLHIPQLWPNWGAAILIFVVGGILGALRERSNSLIPCVIVHVAYNSTLFGMLAVSTIAQNWMRR